MSDLMTTEMGRMAMREAVYDLLKRRLSRYFKRNIMIEFFAWIESGKSTFRIEDVLADLNEHRDPEILNLFELLNRLGGGSQTFQDLTFYVNNMTGDNYSGIGTIDSPFATVSAILNMTSHMTIEHPFRILVQHTGGAGRTVYSDDVWYVPHAQGNGSVSIIGVAAPYQTKAAQTLNAVNLLGQAGHEFNVAGAPWSTDTWIGEFMRNIDGAKANYCHPIANNDSSNLLSRRFSDAPAGGDQIDGIIPRIQVKLGRLSSRYSGPNEINAAGEASRFNVHNLELDFSASTQNKIISFDGVTQCVWLDFVSIILRDGGSLEVYVENTWLNSALPIDTTLGAVGQTGLNGIGTWTAPAYTFRRETQAIKDNQMMYSVNSIIGNACMPEGCDCYTDTVFTSSSVNQLVQYNGAKLVAALCYLPVGDGIDFGVYCSNGFVVLSSCYFGPGINAVRAKNGIVELSYINECDAAMSGHALVLETNCQASIDGSPAAFTGVTGDIGFVAPNPDVTAAWPAAGALVGDALGGAGVHSSIVSQAG